MEKIKAEITIKVKGDFELDHDETSGEFKERVRGIYENHCGNTWLGKQDIETNVDIKVIPKLKKKVVTQTTIEYDDFEEFVQDCYGGVLEFVAIQEANNNSSYTFDVGLNDYLMADKDMEEAIRRGEYPMYSINHIFKCLYEDGFIEAGEYLINVNW